MADTNRCRATNAGDQCIRQSAMAESLPALPECGVLWLFSPAFVFDLLRQKASAKAGARRFALLLMCRWARGVTLH